MRDYSTLHVYINSRKETACSIVRKDMDVNEYERLFNITLRHKLK